MRASFMTKILLITALVFSCSFLYSQSTEQQFKSAVEMGDKYFESKDYINAKASYSRAVKLNPENEYSKNRLTETLKLLRAQMKIKSRFAIETTKADVYFEAKKYREAVNKYKDALKILPDEKYPREQIDKINKIIADEIARKENYSKAIVDGEKYYANSEFEKARDEYLKAIKLDPKAGLPKEKLSEIRLILSSLQKKRNEYNIAISNADFFFKKNEFEKAINEYKEAGSILPNESLPKDKISVIQEIVNSQNKYDKTIEKADEYYIVKDFENARIAYLDAIKQNPDKSYPQEMLEKIKTAIANKKTTEEQDYKNAINNGNKFFEEKKFKDAENEFKFAARLKPGEEYPNQKLKEIDKIILEIAREEEARKNYEDAIAKADKYFSDENYSESRKLYRNALNIIPGETYPLTKVSEINSILKEISDQEEILKEYNTAISDADGLFESRDYEKAKSKYLDARNVKPSEEYPKKQIDEIDKILAEIEAKRSAEEKYQISIAKADELFKIEDYPKALKEYKNAKKLKPSEKYADKQIIIINKKLEEIEAENLKIYNLLITKADSFFNEEHYTQAKEAYQKASKLFSDEIYPREKINECNAAITTLRKAKQQKYDIAIADADKFYNAKIYDHAIFSFQKAKEILPFEKYPSEMIEKINKLMDSNTLATVNSEMVLIKSNNIKEFIFDPLPVKKRKNNYILIKIKNKSDEAIKAILSYGSKDSKNGGTIIKIPQSKNIKDYFIRIGVQYKWFSEDNNWISLTPEGGDIEVSLIRISRGD